MESSPLEAADVEQKPPQPHGVVPPTGPSIEEPTPTIPKLLAAASVAVGAVAALANDVDTRSALGLAAATAICLIVPILVSIWTSWGIQDARERWPVSVATRIPTWGSLPAATGVSSLTLVVTASALGSTQMALAAGCLPMFVAAAWVDAKTNRIPALLCWGGIFLGAPAGALTVAGILTDTGTSTGHTWVSLLIAAATLTSLALIPLLLSTVSFLVPRGLGAGDTRLVWAFWWLATPWVENNFTWFFLTACATQIAAHLVLSISGNAEPGVRKVLPFGPALTASYIALIVYTMLNG